MMEFKLSRESYFIRQMIREFERNGRMIKHEEYTARCVYTLAMYELGIPKEEAILRAKQKACANFIAKHNINEFMVTFREESLKPHEIAEDIDMLTRADGQGVFKGEIVTKEMLWKISETHSINLKVHFRYEVAELKGEASE